MAQKCGCKTEILYDEFDGDKVLISYCPMHKAAPDLVAALKEVKLLLDDIYAEDVISSGDLSQAYEKVEKDLALVGKD